MPYHSPCDHGKPHFGCVGCIDRSRIYEPFGSKRLDPLIPPHGGWPDWYTPARQRATQNANVRKGLHPLGMRLRGSETCGGCVHAIKRGRYWKCDRMQNTHGPATDIRKRYMACDLWEAADG